ncbi:MAG: PCP reductase family protein, partial [Candidatus Tectomicrobia bacterium]|nr:PCP reductase family protein [Candidatus Tectomicrobia bacterium]
MESEESHIIWTDDALERLHRAPPFLQGMVRKLSEKRARELGYTVITGEILGNFKDEMMVMGGVAGAEAGRLPWTKEAEEYLLSVPEFMRAMTRRIIEESASEFGNSEVTPDIVAKVEALGEEEANPDGMRWTVGARGLL